MNPLPSSEQLEHFAGRQKARRRAELLALEMAQSADAAARETLSLSGSPEKVAVATGASARAWADLAGMLKPNGEKD